MLLQAAIAQLEQGIEQVGDSFQTLDQQLGHIGQTATRIGDRLQVGPAAASPQLTPCSYHAPWQCFAGFTGTCMFKTGCTHGWPDLQHLAVLQSAEGFRTRAQEAMKLLQDMQQFAAADTFDDLSDLYSDPARLAEAAVSGAALNSCLPLSSLRKRASLLGRGLLHRSAAAQVDWQLDLSLVSKRPMPPNSVAYKLGPLAVQAMTGQMMSLALEVTSSKEHVGLDEQQLKASGELAPKVRLAASPMASAGLVSAEAATWRPAGWRAAPLPTRVPACKPCLASANPGHELCGPAKWVHSHAGLNGPRCGPSILLTLR